MLRALSLTACLLIPLATCPCDGEDIAETAADLRSFFQNADASALPLVKPKLERRKTSDGRTLISFVPGGLDSTLEWEGPDSNIFINAVIVSAAKLESIRRYRALPHQTAFWKDALADADAHVSATIQELSGRTPTPAVLAEKAQDLQSGVAFILEKRIEEYAAQNGWELAPPAKGDLIGIGADMSTEADSLLAVEERIPLITPRQLFDPTQYIAFFQLPSGIRARDQAPTQRPPRASRSLIIEVPNDMTVKVITELRMSFYKYRVNVLRKMGITPDSVTLLPGSEWELENKYYYVQVWRGDRLAHEERSKVDFGAIGSNVALRWTGSGIALVRVRAGPSGPPRQ
jgi:hypothetical protein